MISFMLQRPPGHKRIPARLSFVLLVIALCANPASWASAQQMPPCEAESGRITPTTVPSTIYGKPVAVNVFLPPCYGAGDQSQYPVIYLLHGGFADETQWPDLAVQNSANALINHGAAPFVVVMPGALYYESIDYGAFVIKDLLPSIESQYRVAAMPSGRAIGGLSLGGYWALKIVFSHPDLFTAIGAYSPVVDRGQSDDPLPAARHINARTLQDVSIALDVGDADSLAFGTKLLAQALRTRGLTVQFTTAPGGHNRSYWRAHTYDYFSFFIEKFASAQSTNGPEP